MSKHVETLIQELIKLNRAAGPYHEWQSLVNQIVSVGEPAIPSLIDALLSVPTQKRSEIAFILGMIGSTRTVPALLDLLEDDSDEVRIDALHALGKIGDPTTIAAIAAALFDENEYVQSAAAIALGSIHHHDSVQALIAVLGKPGRVHGYAKFAFGQLGNRSLQPLLDYLEIVTDERFRDEILDALARIDTPEGKATVDRLKKNNI